MNVAGEHIVVHLLPSEKLKRYSGMTGIGR